jgi:hypothetical protein
LSLSSDVSDAVCCSQMSPAIVTDDDGVV